MKTGKKLSAYTKAYAFEYCEENSLICETQLPETVPDIFVSGEIRRNLFLTVKESLHNTVKHAHAKTVRLNFSIDKKLTVSIQDDGAGFVTNKHSDGSGLKNMRKRIESIGGNFEILNEKGTIVNITVPLV